MDLPYKKGPWEALLPWNIDPKDLAWQDRMPLIPREDDEKLFIAMILDWPVVIYNNGFGLTCTVYIVNPNRGICYDHLSVLIVSRLPSHESLSLRSRIFACFFMEMRSLNPFLPASFLVLYPETTKASFIK